MFDEALVLKPIPESILPHVEVLHNSTPLSHHQRDRLLAYLISVRLQTTGIEAWDITPEMITDQLERLPVHPPLYDSYYDLFEISRL